MTAQEVYAQIHDGRVQNVVVAESYEDANDVVRAVYGDDAIAVYCNQYPCQEGDRYHDNTFWRPNEDGTETEIPYIPTEEQQAA